LGSNFVEWLRRVEDCRRPRVRGLRRVGGLRRVKGLGRIGSKWWRVRSWWRVRYLHLGRRLRIWDYLDILSPLSDVLCRC
jgi:hypothetical protein